MTRPLPGFFRTLRTVAALDLRLELRTGDAVLPALLLALMVVVLGSFALAAHPAAAAAKASAVYWLAVALSSHLAVVRQWSREREDAAFDALLLAPVPRAALFAGRAAALALLLLAVEAAAAVPTLLFFPVAADASALWFLPAAGLATVGLALLFALFGAMVTRGAAADVLVGVAVYPLLVPPFLGAVEVTQVALAGGTWGAVSGWLGLLAGFDAVLAAACAWLFGRVVEE